MLFATSDDLHATLGHLLQDVAADPDLAERLHHLDADVELRLRQPDTVLALLSRGREQAEVTLGAEAGAAGPPDVVLTMDADVAHRVWLGQENVAIAVARGRLQARGDVARVVELLALASELAPRYADQLQQAGRQDLTAEPVAEETAVSGADADGATTADGEAPEQDADGSPEDADAAPDAEAPADDAPAGDAPDPAA